MAAGGTLGGLYAHLTAETLLITECPHHALPFLPLPITQLIADSGGSKAPRPPESEQEPPFAKTPLCGAVDQIVSH